MDIHHRGIYDVYISMIHTHRCPNSFITDMLNDLEWEHCSVCGTNFLCTIGSVRCPPYLVFVCLLACTGRRKIPEEEAASLPVGARQGGHSEGLPALCHVHARTGRTCHQRSQLTYGNFNSYTKVSFCYNSKVNVTNAICLFVYIIN